MDRVAQSYVKLVLAVGQHDPDYVDAFYGPAGWKTEAEKAGKRPLAQLRGEAEKLLADLDKMMVAQEEMITLRHNYLKKQLGALVARVEMLEGKKFTFDEESKRLYDVVAPHYSEEHFEKTLARLDKELPGQGTVLERYEAFRKDFKVPPDKLDAVFQAAVDGCRQRTLMHIDLPKSESFTIEYVKNQPWSGYNWYKGDYKSLIQVNTDLPKYISGALGLACHEGYPGHHVYNLLLEKNLVRNRGWVEYTVYPLYSPQSFIAEGTANFGTDVAFPEQERREFEKKVLYPAAGLDPAKADRYSRVQQLTEDLSFATNEAARRYLDGKIDAATAAQWLQKFSLMHADTAKKYVDFIDRYRSYVINYNYGKRLAQEYVEARGGTEANLQKRWQVFEELLSSPRLPSDLLAGIEAAKAHQHGK